MKEKNSKKITIIDYELGNLYSVNQACETVGLNTIVSSKKSDVLDADALILPGVGAFNEAMKNLIDLDLKNSIIERVNFGIPIFGICLGLQLLFTKSEEFGSSLGLDLIKGSIKKFPTFLADNKIKIPHVCWNQVYNNNNSFTNTPLKDLKNYAFMYFVHSYYVKPENNLNILTNTNYDGIEFCSSVLSENIFATQFHPEKSGIEGLSIYKNWAISNNLI